MITPTPQCLHGTPWKSCNTCSHIHVPEDPRIFVFGSNKYGMHAGGAAYYAHTKLSYPYGVSYGHFGQSFAIPTCEVPGVTLPLSDIATYVDMFKDYAREHSHLTFFVSAIGCGIAGLEEKHVAVLFKDAPVNCDLPIGWR